jgi:hypothetical protein
MVASLFRLTSNRRNPSLQRGLLKYWLCALMSAHKLIESNLMSEPKIALNQVQLESNVAELRGVSLPGVYREDCRLTVRGSNRPGSCECWCLLRWLASRSDGRERS